MGSQPHQRRAAECLHRRSVCARSIRASAGEVRTRRRSGIPEEGGSLLYLPEWCIRPIDGRADHSPIASDRNAGHLRQCALPLRIPGAKTWELLKLLVIKQGFNQADLGRSCAGFGTLSSQSGLGPELGRLSLMMGGPSFVRAYSLDARR